MVQLKVYPQEGANDDQAIFLDLYETQPIKLTLSIEDITSADATSVFSRTFKVPATGHNNEFFENAYELDGIDFDITIKKPAQILVDGAEFKIGHVRLQKIYANGDLDKIDYELLFLGETRDFSSAIGELTMCQLQFTDFNWPDSPVEYTNAADFTSGIGQQEVRDSWLAFPQTNSPTAGYADGDLVFPLIDHGNAYQNDDLNAPSISIGGSGSQEQSFTHSQHALPAQRFKPMVRAKRLWDQIFENTGYTYESNFLESEQFLHMYLSAFGNEESITIGVTQDVGTVFGNASSQTFEYFESPGGNNDVQSYLFCSNMVIDAANYNVNVPDVGSGTGGSYYIAPGDAALGGAYYAFEFGAQVDAQIERSDYGYDPIDCAVQLMVVDSIYAAPNDPNNITLDVGNFTSNGNWSFSQYDSRNGGYQPQAGDIFKVFVTNNYSYDISQVDQAYWQCQAAPGNYSPARDLDCEYQQIDFIKDIITMFRLVMQPSPSRPNHFIVEPWKDFIGSGEVYDWSKKLIREKDFVSEPLFNTQSAIIEFTKQEDEDYINKFHQDNNKHAYGWLRFDSQNELLKGKRDVEVIGIAATPIEQIVDTQGSSAHTNPDFILPQIFEVDENKRLPIKPKSRFLFYNGLVTTNGTTWYYKTGPGSNDTLAYVTYPLASPYEYWPITNIAESAGPPPVEAVNTLNLNFANDTRYYMDPTPSASLTEIPNTLFEIFWARYISSLYNKFSRRVTAYFTLNNVDLQTLTFDDVIFIDGKYYRPEKIIDAQIGERTAVKCELITVKDQRPVWRPEPLTGFSIVDTDGLCAGEGGNIQITTDGTPPFNWQLGDPAFQTGQYNSPVGQAPYIFTIEDVPLGSDQVIVTDSFGRTAQATYNIQQSTASPVVATWTVVDATVCSPIAACDGEITVTPSGGVGPYTITWQDGGTGLQRTGLCPEDYMFYITDANGCQSDTYEAGVSCAQPVNNFLLKELLNNCSALSAADYVADSTLQLSQGDIVSLGTGRSGCYQVMGTTTLAANYMVDADYATCADCVPVTPLSYEVEECTTGATVYVSRTGFTLQPGYTVGLVNTAGCYTVIGDSTTVSTDDVQQLYKGCTVCNNQGGYVYYAFFCDGSTSPVYFTSTIQLTQGTIVEVADGIHVGKCVTIISQNQLGTPQGNLDVSVAYTDCASCQGITIDTCHRITTGLTGVEISYQLGGQTYPAILLPGRVYNFCGQNFQEISGTWSTITDLQTTCTDNFDCAVLIRRTSCHTIRGGSTGTTWNYQNSGGIFTNTYVTPFAITTVCAVINSVTKANVSENGTYTDNQSICIQDNDCGFTEIP